ncbi:Hypothetical protein PHPALM_12678 [Phytophthora palmivora]|uniref:WLGC domain-containing protein n=1 Tax=Phytophthora palmivora TaxID=4796 RepID=A0A2P4XZ52_9STRA|nr:Hypothetical protein PHPALM_12678 [Phytophthora palmivora]
MVNGIMDTGDFDDGSFWLFVDPPPGIYRLTIFGLSSIVFGYVFIILKLLTKWRYTTKISPTMESGRKINVLTKTLMRALHRVSINRTASRSLASAATKAALLASNESIARKRILVDLALETAMLIQILEDGSPLVLVAVFTFIIVANATGCALIIFFPLKKAALIENIVDLMFDLLVTVGYPMLSVWYCLSTFSFDRAKLAINLKVFPQGWLETSAGSIADPTQTVVIYKILGALRISSVLNFFTRIGINITLGLKFHRAMDLIDNPRKQQTGVYPKRNLVAAASLVIFAVLIAVYAEECVRTSAIACRPHPECAMHAQRWTLLENSSLSQCPCLALIDNEIAPKTYAEWTNPKNLTNKVAVLAATGDLQIIQLINRNLPELPNEVRGCTGMRYMRVEGHPAVSLVDLPNDMFDDMSVLTTLHLGFNVDLTRLPSLSGLTNLKLLVVAASLSLVELPAFDNLSKLERLVITVVPLLNTLPDLSPIKNLKSFVAMDRGAWCCNGFLGKCDLLNPLCGIHPVWGTPAAICLPANRTASIATRDIAAKFAHSICGEVLRPANAQPFPAEDTMASCNGILYRQCTFPGVPEAICYNARVMGIACTPSKFPIEMRRRQIAQGVGDPCNPEYESWLGCK